MIITSRQNNITSIVRELLRSKKAREERGEFVIEGEKLCIEAADSGLTFRTILATEAAEKKYRNTIKKISENCSVSLITEQISEYISDTKTPQGIFAVIKRLDKSVKLDKIYSSKIIILENVRDPGNVGTIIRTCEALGIDGIVMSNSCADIYSPKVIRSAMGSVFRIPIITADNLMSEINGLKRNGFNIYASVLDDGAVTLNNVNFTGKCAVIIGNEASGISSDLINIADVKMYIPMNNANSLNAAVAAAIFAWEMRK